MRKLLILSIGVLCILICSGTAFGQPWLLRYSNDPDEQIVGFAHNGAAPQQVINTRPPDGPGGPLPANGVNFGGDVDVDALAWEHDLYMLGTGVLTNANDLLVSFLLDPGTTTAPPTSVYRELITGANGPFWSKTALCADVPGVDDVDGLKLPHSWNLNKSDYYYSEVGDGNGTSVWFWRSATGLSQPWLAHGIIVAAVQTLGYEGDSSAVDLDALMIRDGMGWPEWDTLDVCMFSIRAAGNFDGGEIIVLPHGGPPSFLNHGGHIWDTAFDVGVAFDLAPPSTQEVDALEQLRHTSTEVGMSSFNAVGFDNHITVEWVTTSETDLAGFNLYRGRTLDGARVKVNDELIGSKGTSITGAEYSLMDKEVEGGVAYYYWLEDVGIDGAGTMHGPVLTSNKEEEVPTAFSLSQNYPNPFNPTTEIRYDLPVDCHVSLNVYNVLGQKVAGLVDEYQKSGSRSVLWNGKNSHGIEVPSGIYFYKLQAGTFAEIRKMVLLR